jgi:hypothetical protein
MIKHFIMLILSKKCAIINYFLKKSVFNSPWGVLFDNNNHHPPIQAISSPTTTLKHANCRDEQSILDDEFFIDPAKGIYQVRNNSPVLALGFKNFSMDQFGITDPKLKSLACTPFSSHYNTAPLTQPSARDSTPRDFLGASIKNIIGLGEISAHGLPGEIGSFLVQVPALTKPDSNKAM